MATLDCSACGHVESAPDPFVGRQCACPRCRKPTIVRAVGRSGAAQPAWILTGWFTRENISIAAWVVLPFLGAVMCFVTPEKSPQGAGGTSEAPNAELEYSKRRLRLEFPNASEQELDDAARAISEFQRARGK